MTDEAVSKRDAGLIKVFHGVIHGHRDLKSSADAHRFLEALCVQPDSCKVVECVIAAKAGLTAVAKAFRFRADPDFLNGMAASALLYLADPALKQLYNGQFLHRILEQIVQPPGFWNSLIDAHHARALSEKGTQAFAWLLLEIFSCRTDALPDVRDVAERITDNESFINHSVLEVRTAGQKIKHILDATGSGTAGDGPSPGGRHDNDFADFREIKILPTADEFASTERPFYRRLDAIETIDSDARGLIHIDNQFRLLREDLLGELRNDFQIATGQKKGRRKVIITGLEYSWIDCGDTNRRKPCCVKLLGKHGIPQLHRFKTVADRKKFLQDNKNILKHQSLGCLVSNQGIIAFASVDRDEDLLASKPPFLLLRIADEPSFRRVLLTSKLGYALEFVQVDTAVFAYEPILKTLQAMTDMPLHQQILDMRPEMQETSSGIEPTGIMEEVRSNLGSDLQRILGMDKSVNLDDSQAQSLLSGLARRVSLIQGPPGTGKSFIGALIAKVLHDHTREAILVLTYTNHALDQFLVDLTDVGIPSTSILRLGGKFSPNTKHMSLSEQRTNYKMSPHTFQMIDNEKSKSESYLSLLMGRMSKFKKSRTDGQSLLDYLEFSEDSEFFDAFEVPESFDGFKIIGEDGKAISAAYLVERWVNGQDAGVLGDAARLHSNVWSIDKKMRIAHLQRWAKEMVEEQVVELGNLMQKYDLSQERQRQLYRQKTCHIMEQKRIIGCTTTAAAMMTDELRKLSPGIVLVEEAGEILESHILTAMTPQTRQLVLIGDHKQLRPKVNNYDLTIEKGDGYNLNQSMFERLVLAGVPHTTLNRQHRMRPEISSLVRGLTYPELEDAPSTKNRPVLRGFQDSIVFVSHSYAELNAGKIADRRDEGATASKENQYEVEMVLKCLRYLGQQGYGTDDIVILTPYLGQLYLLLKTLGKDNDPILNDLDSFELIRAGLLTPASADVAKRRIRISTIDNYQGEESDIVIASLTRSNDVGDIGFMSSPQRVNVLLSRARNALIIVGNAETFLKSRKGKDVWAPLMAQLQKAGHIYNGFPIKCEQHPDRLAFITEAGQFDTTSPDGGCSEPCGKLLNCQVHSCPHSCHQLQDHSKMKCTTLVEEKCPLGHKNSRRCHNKTKTCPKCQQEARERERKRQRDLKLDEERQERQRAYSAKLAQVQEEFEYQRRLWQNQVDDKEREDALAQKVKDLDSLKGRVQNFGSAAKPKSSHARSPSQKEQNQAQSDPLMANRDTQQAQNAAQGTAPQAGPSGSNGNRHSDDDSSSGGESEDDQSGAQGEWDWQKTYLGADNDAIDALMDMIGLEAVKQKFLDIKSKVDTAVRQNVALTGERFGAALLGNPGTGKTTVARLYANFLMRVGALPGDHFVETTGSALANEGVNGCKAHIDKILQEGGGVFFIDEAYQLVSGNSMGGGAVLDFLLAEIENLTGKIVFVMAGYHKQMETFFAHNPGIPSRIPITMEFEDYTDKELQRIFCQYINKRYKCNMKIEGGIKGLYVRIVARRIGSGRGRNGFGNAREVQNRISQITERQAKRLRRQRRSGTMPDDFLLAKEDLIGSEPSAVLKHNAAWKKLQQMIGLNTIKGSVQILLDTLQHNHHRELEEKPLISYSLNRCFLGSPGTGKTSIAKLYGRILADIGMLSNGEVVVKNPADFIGQHIGSSEANTKSILASTVGKVLVIDEAYMLSTKSGGSTADPYKTAVIDTIVAEVQSTPGEDRCVLLLGYKEQMEEMFRDVNPGLSRRFPLDSAFVFEDFTDSELRQILEMKLKDIGFKATDQAKRAAMEMLQRARNQPNFGNAGEVDIILDKAKAQHQKHLSSGKCSHRDTFEAIDFDPDFDRGQRAATRLPELFQGVFGCEDLVKQLQKYQTTAANMKSLGMDPREQIPFNFLFKGPPGTGKTTTAQKMGKVYYDMGFLANAKVVECSATDMIGQYVGQTGPKVQELLGKALGKVLFIDEAYRLAEGPFATEAMDELVDCLTKPRFAQKLIVILAGYDKDMDRLMGINPGLTSRFPETVIFKPMDAETCLQLLTNSLARNNAAPLDLSVLQSPSAEIKRNILDRFEQLFRLSGWANARDVNQIAKNIFHATMSEATPPITKLTVTEDLIISTMQAMISERSSRNSAVGSLRFGPSRRQQPMQTLNPEPPNAKPPPPPSTSKKVAPPPKKSEEKKAKPPLPTEEDSESDNDGLESILKVKRDSGVSDAEWEQLEHDKRAMIAREREYRRELDEAAREERRLEDLKKAEKAAADEEERRQREAQRVQAELERRKNEERRAAMEKLREEERQVQKKLRGMGRCPVGYSWIKQSGGYRCAGGSHWLPDSALGL